MPSVFLSYSRDDLPRIEQLEVQLKADPEISIWRDQEKIYGGQKWPKVLGEAIADQDVFLLAWSKKSSVSHFVEFEWNTAIALKKTIVPCLLDDTPLAPSLRTFQGYLVRDVVGLTKTLAAAPLADPGRRTPVLRKLNDIVATDETTVLTQAKAVFAQQQWTVQGIVYQAGGDIHIHHDPAHPSIPEKPKPLVEKWQAWVGLLVGILTAITLVIELFPTTKSNPPHKELQSEVMELDQLFTKAEDQVHRPFENWFRNSSGRDNCDDGSRIATRALALADSIAAFDTGRLTAYRETKAMAQHEYLAMLNAWASAIFDTCKSTLPQAESRSKALARKTLSEYSEVLAMRKKLFESEPTAGNTARLREIGKNIANVTTWYAARAASILYLGGESDLLPGGSDREVVQTLVQTARDLYPAEADPWMERARQKAPGPRDSKTTTN